MAEFNPNPRTDPTLVSGTRGPENQNTARVVVDRQDEILLSQPEATPLLTLTGKMRKKREAVNARFEWLEKDEYPRSLEATAAADRDDTALSVVAGPGGRGLAGGGGRT